MNKTIATITIIILVIVFIVLSFWLGINYIRERNEGGEGFISDINMNYDTLLNSEKPSSVINAINQVEQIPEPAINTTPVPTPDNINADSDQSVIITNFAFQPQKLNVLIGTTITWTNDDPAPHRITFADFSSQILNTGDTYKYIFTQSGTFDYYCSLHPTMTGQIIVQ
jgi:plastocyanin